MSNEAYSQVSLIELQLGASERIHFAGFKRTTAGYQFVSRNNAKC